MPAGSRVFVFSRTLAESHPNVELVSEATHRSIARIKNTVRRDVWLVQGGELFFSVAAIGAAHAADLTLSACSLVEERRRYRRPPMNAPFGLLTVASRNREWCTFGMTRCACMMKRRRNFACPRAQERCRVASSPSLSDALQARPRMLLDGKRLAIRPVGGSEESKPSPAPYFSPARCGNPGRRPVN